LKGTGTWHASLACIIGRALPVGPAFGAHARSSRLVGAWCVFC
jgi:hypothetical protein